MALQTVVLSASGKSAMSDNYTYALILSYDDSTSNPQVTVKAYILCPDSGSGKIFYFVDCTASCTINGVSVPDNDGIVEKCECSYGTSLDNLPSNPLWSKTVTPQNRTISVSGSFTHSSSDPWMPPTLSINETVTLGNPISIVFNGQEVTSVVFNGQTVEHWVYNGQTVF